MTPEEKARQQIQGVLAVRQPVQRLQVHRRIQRPAPSPQHDRPRQPRCITTIQRLYSMLKGEEDFDEAKPGEPREKRRAIWSEGKNPDGRWRAFSYDEIIKRDKANLDIFWLKDKSLEDSDDLPAPDVLAQEIVDDLQTALDQFAAIAGELKE